MAVKKTTEIKSEPLKQKTPIFVNIARFIYKGDEAYYFKDDKGFQYAFNKGDIIFINDDEDARYFDYKSALFERVLNEK